MTNSRDLISIVNKDSWDLGTLIIHDFDVICLFGSDRSSRSHNLRASVRVSGSSLSRALKIHLFNSDLKAALSSSQSAVF